MVICTCEVWTLEKVKLQHKHGIIFSTYNETLFIQLPVWNRPLQIKPFRLNPKCANQDPPELHGGVALCRTKPFAGFTSNYHKL